MRVSRETRRMNVRADLRKQLRENGMDTHLWLDLIEDYMKFWDLKEELQKSIRTKGAMVTVENGKQRFYKRNDAVVELPKVSKRMTDILDKLKIQVAEIKDEGEGDDDV
ncbi:hypothetical protein SPD48_09545 [Pseudogracilibacillus sp. SE30717A]|uniref:P27 family phage terminase small subunit n=1 Tax=Pseudogracilibacillus sp. SE30717A TaxID=3098293 RepID=UPI00300E5E42